LDGNRLNDIKDVLHRPSRAAPTADYITETDRAIYDAMRNGRTMSLDEIRAKPFWHCFCEGFMASDFIPYGRQDINDDDIAAVVSVLKSGDLNRGPAFESFESSFFEVHRL
jgi:hypothetical protein